MMANRESAHSRSQAKARKYSCTQVQGKGPTTLLAVPSRYNPKLHTEPLPLSRERKRKALASEKHDADGFESTAETHADWQSRNTLHPAHSQAQLVTLYLRVGKV